MSEVAILYKGLYVRYINCDSYPYCPICGEEYVPDDDEIDSAIIDDESVYCECGECGESFYLGAED